MTSIFYKACRVGLHGKPFKMFKFRTMVEGADQIGSSSTPNDDPRITPLGRWLRRHKIDELPQLWNVLKGDMNIVGPRPEVQEYVDLFTAAERMVLGVRPGITDLASLWNSDEGAWLAGREDPDRFYLEEIRPTKVRLQLEYIRRQSLALDIQIIFRTIFRKGSKEWAIGFLS